MLIIPTMVDPAVSIGSLAEWSKAIDSNLN